MYKVVLNYADGCRVSIHDMSSVAIIKKTIGVMKYGEFIGESRNQKYVKDHPVLSNLE